MPRKLKVIPGPSRLSIILKRLTAQPRPSLSDLAALNLKLAARNDHFGARSVRFLYVLPIIPRLMCDSTQAFHQGRITTNTLCDPDTQNLSGEGEGREGGRQLVSRD